MFDNVKNRIKNGLRKSLWHNQPLKRRGQPLDIANAALFLGSDRSIYSTGGVISVDGGISAGDPVNHIQEMIDARARVIADQQG